MEKNSNTFVFDLEWYGILKAYPSDVRMEVYEAIMEYASSGKTPELKPLANMAFSFIRPKMDYNRGRYEERVEKRRQAGAKGGSARKAGKAFQADDESGQTQATLSDTEQTEADLSIAKQTQADEANASVAKQTQAKPSINDSESGSGIVSGSGFDEEKNLSHSHAREEFSEISDRKAFLDIFFGSPKLDDYLRRWETTPKELRGMCEAVLDDWTLKGKRHLSPQDARGHFVDAVRTRYENKIVRQTERGSKGYRPSGKVYAGTAGKTPPAESDVERLDRQHKERAEAFAEQERNAVKPADYIRSLGYDPEKVTMMQVMSADWRAKNPPTH